ncbi:hypothetical protein EV360DRAFT_41216 [Lentinula raphanica]|nr:hypothetical protein EV360DRAFT_41216 [Lentinula raphanica]
MKKLQPPDNVVPVASRYVHCARFRLILTSDQTPLISSTPAAKRPRADADNASVKSSKGHIRNKSSVASLKNIQLSDSATPPSSAKKPASSRGHKPMQPAPSESDFDDGASIADSVISVNRVRRSEHERIEYFKNQPECGSLEPNRVKCLRCQKYVALGKRTTYNVRPWEKHRATCDLKPAVECVLSSPDGADAIASAETVSPHRTSHETEEERKSILFADPNVQEVEPNRVLCKKCNSWIRLNGSNYDPGNWKSHNKSCGVPVPSSKVATAERKLKLVNDNRVESFGVNHVICGTCNVTVALKDDMDYNLTQWDEHKAGCPEPGSIPFPTQGAKPPESIGSTSTVVSPEESASKGVKRRLDDSEADLPQDDPDARPQNRPRTDAYVAPDKEPGVLGWFMMPFKSFVRGFKESLNKDASMSTS